MFFHFLGPDNLKYGDNSKWSKKNELLGFAMQQQPDTSENSTKSQSVFEWRWCGKWDVCTQMLCISVVTKLKLWDTFNYRIWDSERKKIWIWDNERVSSTVLQLCLIWTCPQILEQVREYKLCRSKTAVTPKIKFFVTLIDVWRLQTNNTTKPFILDVAMVLDTSLWNN